MALLYLIGQLHCGGTERQLYYLLKAMDRKRHKPAVAVWNFSNNDVYVPQLEALGVPLYPIPRGYSAVARLHSFCRLIDDLKPKVIHSYSFYLNFAAYWAARGRPITAIGSSRSDLIFNRNNSGSVVGRLSARWPRYQISNNLMAVKRAFSERTFFAPRNFSIIRNCIDFETFRMLPLSQGNSSMIAGVGSLIPVKRWDRLLVAASELKSKGLNFHIQIAGDGPLRRQLQLQTTKLGVADRVDFLGYIDDVSSFLANSAILVHTSDLEGCPNSVMEAMACGRAVIATNAGDTSFLVQEGRTGFIVPRGDTNALVDRLSQLIIDGELCRSMGEAGRAMAEAEFRVDQFVKQTLAAYENAGWSGA